MTSIYDKLADGINSDVGVAGSQLFLGMQKVTMLVRGICRNTPVVILDEPLAGLDTTTRSENDCYGMRAKNPHCDHPRQRNFTSYGSCSEFKSTTKLKIK